MGYHSVAQCVVSSCQTKGELDVGVKDTDWSYEPELDDEIGNQHSHVCRFDALQGLHRNTHQRPAPLWCRQFFAFAFSDAFHSRGFIFSLARRQRRCIQR